MISIVLIGTGNVAHHLFLSFLQAPSVTVRQVVGRNPEKSTPFSHTTKVTTDFNDITVADVYIIAVSDNAIELVSNALGPVSGLVVHTSGTMELSALKKHPHSGVFYPLQSFSKEKSMILKNVPLCLEVKNEADFGILEELALAVSESVFQISSKQRKHLHLAAVFVNNFSNHLFHIGETICKTHELPFELLKPLIEETVCKLHTMQPLEAQTGPAKRNDTQTMQAHLALLENKNHIALYKLLSNSILEVYGKKL